MSTKKKGFLNSVAFKVFMKYLYGLGAAVVIGGALFKIMHWPLANEMLIAGMGTEVVVFMVSAFEPLHEEIDWGRVYPQLNEEVDEEFKFEEETDELSPEQALALAEKEMQGIDISNDTFSSLQNSLEGLRNNVSKLANIEDATVAHNEYATAMREATGKVSEMSGHYSSTINAMSAWSNSVASAASDSGAYHDQVQAITKNLSSLNAVYEMELNDAKSHLKTINEFYGNLSRAMGDMMEAADGAEEYKREVTSLTSNLKQLNNVYNGMLNAMGGKSGGA